MTARKPSARALRIAALRQATPLLDEWKPGHDAYLSPLLLRQLRREAGARWWTFRGELTSAELSGGEMVKSGAGIADHTGDPVTFAEFIRECTAHGKPRPSSYADVFHAMYHSPRVRWSLHEPLSHRQAGGWQQALRVGYNPGEWRKYDITSAYLGAASPGLPDVKAYRIAVGRILPGYDGVYLVELSEPTPTAPFPFNSQKLVNATPEEIEVYGLRVARILRGTVWPSGAILDPAPIFGAMRQLSFWKKAARGYWGRWAQTDPVGCHTSSGKTWLLRNPATNLAWAHLIVGRVRRRAWDAVQLGPCCHVFVDSVITQAVLPTGSGVGDWRQETVYPDGVMIYGAGVYGAPDRLDKAAGFGGKMRVDLQKRWDSLAEFFVVN